MEVKNVFSELASKPEGSFLDVVQFNGGTVGACSITGTSPVWELRDPLILQASSATFATVREKVTQGIATLSAAMFISMPCIDTPKHLEQSYAYAQRIPSFFSIGP